MPRFGRARRNWSTCFSPRSTPTVPCGRAFVRSRPSCRGAADVPFGDTNSDPPKVWIDRTVGEIEAKPVRHQSRSETLNEGYAGHQQVYSYCDRRRCAAPSGGVSLECHLIDPDARQDVLAAAQRLKMARSAHAYVRGNTADFYDWLRHLKRGHLPEGPPVWICGDCHVGNLGPLAHSDGRVEIQIRDLDQTVIGNPTHDLVRLGLSLASAARGSDLPGVTTARILEQIIEGYAAAMEPGQTGEDGDDIPEAMRVAVKTARRRSWHHLAKERIENIKPTIPLGKRFWPLATDERSEITRLFEKDHVRQLATMLRSRKDNAPVEILDAAYWKKGCSSLGKLRYCVLLGVGDKQWELCLMDVKEAVQAAAPADDSADMPEDQAQRVVEGARHLSPHLGERMRAIQLFGRSIFIRELLPQVSEDRARDAYT